jgi:O-antigen biosynthesis protein
MRLFCVVRMSGIKTKLAQTFERLTHERLPIASLLQQRPTEGHGADKEMPLQVQEVEIGGAKCDFVPVGRSSPLSFRTRLAPHSFFSVVIGAQRSHSGATFVIAVESDGNNRVLQKIGLEESRGATSRSWRRVTLDLNQFSRQEITLFLSADSRRPEDKEVLGWANPRILRQRSVREYYANLRSRMAQGGIRAVLQTTRALLKGQPHPLSIFADYPRWLRTHSPTKEDLIRAAQSVTSFRYQPLISVVTPTFNTDPAMLRKCIQSIRDQVYPNWELCICDDGSTSDTTRRVIEEFAQHDSRIKAQFLQENQGIAEATNAAIRLASGEFFGLLDHDDELSADALYENVRLLQEHSDADVIYSDEDKLDVDGNNCEPFFKPDWSPELFLSCMYTCHFSVYRRELVNAVGGFRPGFEGAQDYDFMLRVSEHTDRIFHIPKVLYHWRKSLTSTAGVPGARSRSIDAGLRALRGHVERIELPAEVIATDRPNSYRVKPAIRGNPLVSIIICHKDLPAMLNKCIQSITRLTTYRNYEILIVDNGSTSAEAQQYLSSLPYRILAFNEPFNFSRMNNFAARECKGEYLLLLNDDTEVISPEWLTAMLGYAQLPEIGAVGAKLYYPHDSIQHAGVILGMRGIAGHWLYRFPRSSRGYFNSLHMVRNFSAVTAACILIRRAVFETVGGFEEQLPISYNDVDLCLRIRQAGYRIVCVPEAELYHCEFASRPQVLDPREVEYMEKRWSAALREDPYYNRNLTLDSGALALRF